MKPDFYTKSVMTMILICLVIITLNQLCILPKFYSNTQTAVYTKTPTPDLKYGLVPLNEDGSINVNIKSCMNDGWYAGPLKVVVVKEDNKGWGSGWESNK